MASADFFQDSRRRCFRPRWHRHVLRKFGACYHFATLRGNTDSSSLQVLPDFPTYQNSKFLTEEERILACNRLAIQGIGLTQGAHGRVGEWKAFKMVIFDWRTWCLCFVFVLTTGAQTMQVCINLDEVFGTIRADTSHSTSFQAWSRALDGRATKHSMSTC